jgi:hypothetical protein
MTDERERQIEKDTLWDYTQAKFKIDTLRFQFKTLAERFENTAAVLRERPEDLMDSDFSGLKKECSEMVAAAKEYQAMLYKNAERHDFLQSKGINV